MNQPPAARSERWSALEQMILLKAYKAGKTPTEIYREGCLSQPPRSWYAIVLKWRHLSLARSQTKPKSAEKKWTQEEKQQFDDYVRCYSFSKTPEEIATHWHIHSNTVIKWQSRLNVRPRRQHVMAMQFSREKQKRGQQRQRLAKQQQALTWKQRTYRKLTEWAQKLRQREYPPDEQICRTCEISWPKWKKFFRFNEYRTSLGTQRWYRKDCVLCEYEKRNAKKRKATG